jgi:hypothetical protein
MQIISKFQLFLFEFFNCTGSLFERVQILPKLYNMRFFCLTFLYTYYFSKQKVSLINSTIKNEL